MFLSFLGQNGMISIKVVNFELHSYQQQCNKELAQGWPSKPRNNTVYTNPETTQSTQTHIFWVFSIDIHLPETKVWQHKHSRRKLRGLVIILECLVIISLQAANSYSNLHYSIHLYSHNHVLTSTRLHFYNKTSSYPLIHQPTYIFMHLSIH